MKYIERERELSTERAYIWNTSPTQHKLNTSPKSFKFPAFFKLLAVQKKT